MANVVSVDSYDEQTWSITFDDDVTLACAKKEFRNDERVDSLISDHENTGDDPDHTERMKAMIEAVREHEAQ